MSTEEKKATIIEKLRKYGKINNSMLAEELDVSEVTIRNYLRELESKGLLKRVRGGAVSISAHRYDPVFQEQIAIDVEEKRDIAKITSKLVDKNDVIFIDAGSTALFFAEELLKNPPINITIVTNSLYIMNKVAEFPNVKMLAMGGFFQLSTMNFLDLNAGDFFRKYNINKAFVGINGFDELGYYASTLLESEAKSMICKTVSDLYIMASSSKHFKKSLVLINEWTGKEKLVTAGFSAENIERINQLAKGKSIKIINDPSGD